MRFGNKFVLSFVQTAIAEKNHLTQYRRVIDFKSNFAVGSQQSMLPGQNISDRSHQFFHLPLDQFDRPSIQSRASELRKITTFRTSVGDEFDTRQVDPCFSSSLDYIPGQLQFRREREFLGENINGSQR